MREKLVPVSLLCYVPNIFFYNDPNKERGQPRKYPADHGARVPIVGAMEVHATILYPRDRSNLICQRERARAPSLPNRPPFYVVGAQHCGRTAATRDARFSMRL